MIVVIYIYVIDSTNINLSSIGGLDGNMDMNNGVIFIVYDSDHWIAYYFILIDGHTVILTGDSLGYNQPISGSVNVCKKLLELICLVLMLMRIK